ncbi:hypothetical protein [Rhodanobacter geophilus]|uniref:Uncharacterized protein n=1 Tax=Rhodanobacter geophilus TaxID=3162488 RepID=A0ABV3QTL7_9GAMM
MINPPVRSAYSRPLRMRQATLLLVLLAVLSTGTVRAQDEVAVSDQTVRTNTGDIKSNTRDIKSNTSDISKQIGGSTSDGSDTVNGHLKFIDSISNGDAPASSSSAVAPPKVALVDISADTSTCSGVATQQQTNCQDIINTENSQYQYMKAMYDITTSRENDLKALIRARQNIGAEEFGKLADNTNKLIALRAQMDIDRQQMESAYYAYTTRLRYLQKQQAQLADAANKGGSTGIIQNTISQITSGAILAGALSVPQTNNGAKKLSIEDSNGF